MRGRKFFGKLIFKTKEQGCDFIRPLIKMDKFHIFHWGVFQYDHPDNKQIKICLKIFNEHTQVHEEI